MRVLYVAEAPSRARRAGFAPSLGFADTKLASTRRFRELAGDDAPVVNLFAYPLARDGKGSVFPLVAARRRARALPLHGHDRIVLVGKRVGLAFLFDETTGAIATRAYFHWTWCPLRAVVAAIVPHPSGVNAWWNDAANVERARAFFTSLRADG